MKKEINLPIFFDQRVEQLVLGYALISEEKALEVIHSVTINDFWDGNHKIIFSSLCHVIKNKETFDAYTISRTMDPQAPTSGIVSIIDLSSFVGISLDIEYYIQNLREISLKRSFVEKLYQLILQSKDFPKDQNFIDYAQNEISQVKNFFNKAKNFSLKEICDLENFENGKNFTESLQEKIEYYEKTGTYLFSGIRSGFFKFDYALNGFKKGGFYVLGAQTSVGKTTFALNIAKQVASQGNEVLLFLLEMQPTEIAKALISSQIGVSLTKIDRGTITSQEMDDISTQLDSVRNLPIYINNAVNNGLSDIRSAIRQHTQQATLKLVIIDYLQLIQTNKGSENRQVEISEISRTLKLLALEFDVPIFALTQLNRKSLERVDTRPRLSDVRESGSIEQDADCVMFLHREDYNKTEFLPNVNQSSSTELIIAKNRQGVTTTIKFDFQKSLAKFVEQ